ncbi:DUF6973 domain-containing protein [Frigoriflavimonas asaccharolytica]|uniref:DUF6973 domain-containing protein n=1 Tax=Frigoriflavimonas asaccharolytica TaxID=2735899 RepID=A0A8J8G879_9FLAO|nr:hypothetical protein [Frigoriflavimonas asaccharolytica]NRS91060.1 hypothetical protein [Frigoriflavimonas asaccharolytica]
MKKAFTIFVNTIRTLTFKKLGLLLGTTIPNPLFTAISFYATLKAFVLAKKYFPKTNSSDGIGNAFRHALWTSLILMYYCKISSPKKALKWCKKITDLHEELFPNEALQKQMDLHNNKVGMDLFMEMVPGIHRQFFESSFLIDELFKKVKTAKILTKNTIIAEAELVYLK